MSICSARFAASDPSTASYLLHGFSNFSVVPFTLGFLLCFVFTMNSQSTPKITAEFIIESPGHGVQAQRAARRRGMETHRKWIINWMKRLPQGEEDWNNDFPCTIEDIEGVRRRLTLAHLEDRQQMDWLALLHTYAACAKDFDGRELQLHNMIMVAACHVAHSDGLAREAMQAAMAKCISGGSDTLRSKRFALPKCIQIGDELAKVLGSRAYELPLRGKVGYLPL